jgi:aminoglycoside phosphotransferase (APT) family kinase protein
MKQEPRIHQLLLEQTDVPVPKIHVYDDSHEIIANDFLIMDRIPGQPMSDSWGIDSGKVLHRVGECLKQVHQLTAEKYGYIGEHQPMAAQNNWVDAFHIMWNKLIDDIASTGHYTEAEENRLRNLLDDHISCFEHPVKSCLLHMDVWGQNIMVDQQGNLTGLIDWDRALWGDLEIEFAVLDYCGISEPPFWQGYGQPRDTSQEAQIRRIFYILYELQKYIAIRHFRSKDPAAARSYKSQVMSLLQQAFG